MDGAQWQVGLGKYAYKDKGYRKIATVGEDYSFIYTQVFGLGSNSAAPAARSPTGNGSRSAPRILPR